MTDNSSSGGGVADRGSDDLSNNLVVTGALFALLYQARDAALTTVEVASGNHIDVRFAFMKSAYRITVERIPDDEAGPVT